MDTKWIKNNRLVDVLFFIIISSLVYLPRISEFTFFKDDWYFIYDGFIGGPKIYMDIALHTRPIRGYLYQLLFSLFEINPFPYHFLLFITRLLGGFGVFWILNLIWVKQRKTNLFIALLTTIYPGFLWWTGGFEFQAYVLSFSMGIFSILFTLKFILASSIWEKIAWAAGAFLTGWIYLALVEFAIGMEVFRFLVVYLVVSRQVGKAKLWTKLLATFRSAAIFFIIPISFVIWYQFFFDNWRKAQDAGVQFSHLLSSPLTIFWAAIRFVHSTLNVAIFAWGTPFQQNYFGNPLTDIIIGIIIVVIVLFLLLVYNNYLREDPKNENESHLNNSFFMWQNEGFWIGLVGIIGGVLPIILVNRNITFGRLSHYALPASLAGSVFIGSLVYSIFPAKIRVFVLSMLIALATLTHHGVAASSINDAKEVSEFWWQVTWRAPRINTENNTTLLVIYPSVDYSDGDEVAWAPANIIYAPEKQEQTPIEVPISGLRLEEEILQHLLMGSKDFYREDLTIKNIAINFNYKNILVLTQPSGQSCMHALDNRWVGLSISDGAYVITGAEKSNIENIIPSGSTLSPPQELFGSEPPHKWCYYYQKADLARQIGDWDRIIEIFEEANQENLHPNDQIELLPFLQAYAYRGDLKTVKQLSTRINTEAFYKQQACTVLNRMEENGYPLSYEMQLLSEELFCAK